MNTKQPGEIYHNDILLSTEKVKKYKRFLLRKKQLDKDCN